MGSFVMNELSDTCPHCNIGYTRICIMTKFLCSSRLKQGTGQQECSVAHLILTGPLVEIMHFQPTFKQIGLQRGRPILGIRKKRAIEGKSWLVPVS